MKRGFNSGRTGNRKSSSGGGGSGEANVQANWTQSTTTDDAYILNKPNVQYTSAIANATSSVTGLATSTQITKLDGIESSATADQTNLEIKTAYETNADTNEFSDAEQTKLGGIATSANNYTHPTGDGNLHVPATSTTNNAKVLTAGATAGALTWETPASGGGGGWTKIETTTVTSDVASVQFDSISAYDVLKIVIEGWTQDSQVHSYMRISKDNFTNEAQIYHQGRYINSGTDYTSGGYNPIALSPYNINMGNYLNTVIQIHNADGDPVIQWQSMHGTSGTGTGVAASHSSREFGTGRINSIKFSGFSDNITGGTFTLYGI